MNKTFTLVWSAARSAFIVAHEHAKSHGKPSSTSKSAATAAVLLGLLGNAGFALAGPPVAPPVNALPTGGQVAAGAASITQSANRMDINQSTQKAILNWQSFNIGADAQVNFAQPSASAVALNRVLSSDPSAIYGKLNSNGQVFLLNPNGVLFGAGARIDVGGLVASTMKLDDADFMAGNYKFSGGSGSVINQGNLTAAQGGYIALLSPEVRNEGVISASLGTVVLGGEEAVTLSVDATGLSYAVDKGAVQALVENKGMVQADGGQVLLSARSANELASAVINNSGTIEAKGLVAKGGKIILEADAITLTAGSKLDASGATGGGEVLVGGGWQGSGDIYQATTVTMEAGAKIDVSATKVGDGGTAVLWSDTKNPDSVTRANGEFLARGGLDGGDGGRIETSGSRASMGDTFRVDTTAPKGETGLWLIDPHDFTVFTGGTATAISSTPPGDLGAYTLQNALGSTNVTILSSNGATANGLGDINFEDAQISSIAKTLTLTAARNINFRASTANPNGSSSLTFSTGGKLVMNTATTNGGEAGVTGGRVNFARLADGTPTGYVNFSAPVSDSLTINGNVYTVITTLGVAADATSGTNQTLQGLARAENRVAGKYFALGAFINASSTGTNTTTFPNKFITIGGWDTDFRGVFEGLGNTISSLNISSDYNVGLFGAIVNAKISNVTLRDPNIIATGGTTGALVGSGSTGTNTIFNAAAIASGTMVTGRGSYVGGLVGSFSGPSSTVYQAGKSPARWVTFRLVCGALAGWLAI